MGLWQFASGPIVDLALIALIPGPAPGQAPPPVGAGPAAEIAAALVPGTVPAPGVTPAVRGAPPASPPPSRLVDFTLIAGRTGDSEQIAAGTPVSFQDASFRDAGADSFAATAMAIRRERDGLFYLNAWVNGVPVRFLVDTGATTVVLTPADAARAGVMPDVAAFRYTARTAGGSTAMARVRLDQLTAGAARRRGVDAAIAGAGLGVSLLGQSYLSQLRSVRISGDTMVLE